MARGEINLCVARATPVSVQHYRQGQYGREARGLTVSNVVRTFAQFGFGNVVMDSPLWAIIGVHTNAINYTISPEVPTATFGIPLAAGGHEWVFGKENINALKFIRSGIADAQVTITLGW